MTAHWQIIGHDWATAQLAAAIAHQRIGHAYLITGPAGVGRSTLARRFAQALNCADESLTNRPCGLCRSCRLIAAGRHPDVLEVEPEITGRGNPVIRIDQIRALQRDLVLAAVESRYKIAIVNRFEAANPSAANAFLKTLEEPPPRVILLLTASEADTLLETITSRCRTMGLRPVATASIQHALENRYRLPPGEAARLAHLANGRIGWAIRAGMEIGGEGGAVEGGLLARHEGDLDLLRAALREKRVGRFALADQLSRRADELPELLESWLTWWRDALLLSLGQRSDGVLVNIAHAGELIALSEALGSERLLACLRGTERAAWQLARNGNTRLVMENLLLSWPLPAAIPAVS